MTEASSKHAESTSSSKRTALCWLLFPLAHFPLLALLTYDWRSIPALNTPALVSTNWIGALGDNFAFYGYQIFGLAIWLVPFLCLLAIWSWAGRRTLCAGRRKLWLPVMLTAISCILQVLGNKLPAIASALKSINISDAGGAIGYLLMTRLLSPLLNDFGSAVIMIAVLIVSLIGIISIRTISNGFTAVILWALNARSSRPRSDSADSPVNTATSSSPDESPAQTAYQAIMEARAAAKRQREAEKAAAKAQKLAEKEARRLAKEASAPAPVAAPAPTPEPKPATPDKTHSEEPPEDKGPYRLPPHNLLNPLSKSSADHGNVDEMTRRLVDTLKLFGIDATCEYTITGPVVTKYAIRLAPGIKYSAVTNISDNLMGALHAKSLRIEAPIPGEEFVGIEVPNRTPAGISFREIIESDAWKNFKGELPLLFGKDAAGKDLVADLATMPHMLVAGATGQGKSVCLNAIINGLLMTKTPEQLKLIMVDPKSVEFTSYTSIPHLIVPIITENRKVVFSLHWAVAEMEKRLKLFARARVRNIYDFNHRLQFTQTDMFGNDTEINSDMPKTVPYIVIIIDEVADLMAAASKEVTPDIARLAAKARAAGIHLILATQRPDAKIITGTIKANIPGRVAFKTATGIDSRTILDESGAENLIGRGDMLFKSKDGLLIRAQGAWISDPEIASITSFIEKHSNTDFDDRFSKKLSTIKEQEIDLYGDENESAEDAKSEKIAARAQVKADAAADDFKKAVECVINTKRASVSHFQRQMGWGYNHAAKILDMLEARGIVGPQTVGPRQIILDDDQLLAIFNGGSTASEDATVPTETPDAPNNDQNTELSFSTEETI